MAFTVVAYLLIEQDFNEQRVQRKYLRDNSNPLELPESFFTDQFRINKSAFVSLLPSIEPYVTVGSIPLNLQLAATLRFPAEGSYQRSVGNDCRVSVEWVLLNMSVQEKQQSRDYFYNKFELPGIIGCIDGTHVRIIKPAVDEHLFFNRKGYFSMNAMIAIRRKAENAKAYYRRGSAHLGMKNFDEAIRDLHKARELEPNDKVIKAELNNAIKQHNDYNQQQRKALRNLFQ